MSKYSEGYQAALSDIQAVIENTTGDSKGDIRSRTGLNAVERYLDTFFTTPKYKGYTFVPREYGIGFAITAPFGGGLVDFCETIDVGKILIDGWVDAR